MKQIEKHRGLLFREGASSLLVLPPSASSGFARGCPPFLRKAAFPIPHPIPSKNPKRPPGNRAASSLGRIAPTEAKPSELSGEILSLAKYGVKAKT
jgi:hypothetical protein